MSQEELEKINIQIATLQRSKNILATEAIQVNTAVMIGIYLVNSYVTSNQLKDILILLGGLFGIVFSLYVVQKNVRKQRKVRELKKKLDITY
ncbi:MAG: hypothetical protein QY318_03910 [Candidatus Dojkabacteria bacterium]|nr:MAG: hypothetical protein QY318_03910 [Candidatus Dojkabacteria bacterium]